MCGLCAIFPVLLKQDLKKDFQCSLHSDAAVKLQNKAGIVNLFLDCSDGPPW